VLTNGFIACVNVYFLAKMQREKKKFRHWVMSKYIE
jgi:hypothetical protein